VRSSRSPYQESLRAWTAAGLSVVRDHHQWTFALSR